MKLKDRKSPNPGGDGVRAASRPPLLERLRLRPLLQRAVRKVRHASAHGSVFKLYAPQSPAATPGERQRVALVFIIANLGDAIMLFPVLDLLRSENSEAEISVFARGAGSVLALHPAIDHLYLYPAVPPPAPSRRRLGSFFIRPDMAELIRVWREHYSNLRFDACVMPRGGIDPFNAPYLGWMLGGRIRAGYSAAFEPERKDYDLGGELLFTHKVAEMQAFHEVQRGAEVLHLAGLARSQIDITRPVESLVRLSLSSGACDFHAAHLELGGRYAIVAPGASIARRRWNVDGFVEVARSEFKEHGLRPVVVGSPSEAALCKQVASHLGDAALIFVNLQYLELIALCSRASAMLGNDSAIAHVCGALGVPTVIVSAFARCNSQRHFSSVARTHPVGPYVDAVLPLTQLLPCTSECLSDREHCISSVSPSEVRKVLVGLLKRKSADASNTAHSAV